SLPRTAREYGRPGRGPGGAWRQSFPHAVIVTAKPESSLSLSDGLAVTLGREFAPLPQSPEGEWEAEMVFVGYGVVEPKLSYDDFAAVDLQGKVAVALADLSKPLAE